MVWYGMVWYGMVCCGVMWCGTVWCGVVSKALWPDGIACAQAVRLKATLLTRGGSTPGTCRLGALSYLSVDSAQDS